MTNLKFKIIKLNLFEPTEREGLEPPTFGFGDQSSTN